MKDKNTFHIPLSYSRILSNMDEADCRLIWEKVSKRFGISSFSGDMLINNLLDKDQIISAITRFFSTSSNLKNISYQIGHQELKLLRRAIRNGGIQPGMMKDRHVLDSIEVLMQSCLLFYADKTEKKVLSPPLEVCLGIPFDRSEHTGSLLLAFNRYSIDIIKSVAAGAAITVKNRNQKISIAALLYEKTINQYPQSFASLNRMETDILRKVFYSKGRISRDDLNRWAVEQGIKTNVADYRYRYNDVPELLANHHLQNAENTAYQQAILKLIFSGLLGFDMLDSYRYNYDYFIPLECQAYCEDCFFAEIAARGDAIEKEMFTSKPDSSFSYGDRILHDLIMVQIAVACGLIEIASTLGRPKKHSFTRVAQLLNLKGSEDYVNQLLTFRKYSYCGDEVQYLDIEEIDYRTYDMLKGTLLSDPLWKTLIMICSAIDRWARVEHFARYLQNRRELFYYLSNFTDAELNGLVHQLHLLGIIERSNDYRLVRATPLAGRIMDDNEKTAVIDVIDPKEKPLIINSNLEFLVPFNVHISVLKSLSGFAELTVLDRMIHFTISRKSMVKGIGSGWDHDRIINYLNSIASIPVPQAAAYFIRNTASKKGEVRVIPCRGVIKCTGLGIKEKIASIKNIKATPLAGTEDYLCILNGDPFEIVKILKKKGIFAEIME